MRWIGRFCSRGCLGVLCLVLALQGCARTQRYSLLGQGGDHVEGSVEMGMYQLRAGDEVRLQVYREPDISGTFRLDATGQIRHPLFGSFAAAGRTADELEEELIALLGERYLVNPRVTVTVMSAQSLSIVILGEVRSPGVHTVPMGGKITLLQAIAQAGGFTDLARVNRVTITRTVEGRERQIRVRVSRIIAGEDADIQVEPNDVIVVPQILF